MDGGSDGSREGEGGIGSGSSGIGSGPMRAVRSNTPVSCNNCRARKTRCAGSGTSACPYCVSRGLACTYASSKRVHKRDRRRAGPAKTFLPDGSSAIVPAPGVPGLPELAPATDLQQTHISHPLHAMAGLAGAAGLGRALATATATAPTPAHFSAVPGLPHQHPYVRQPAIAPLLGIGMHPPADLQLIAMQVATAPPSWAHQQLPSAAAAGAFGSQQLQRQTSTTFTNLVQPPPPTPPPPPPPPPTLAELYPTIPAQYLPSLDIVNALIDLHLLHRNNFWSFIHLPTFRVAVAQGRANRALLLVILWSGLMVAPRNSSGKRYLPDSSAMGRGSSVGAQGPANPDSDVSSTGSAPNSSQPILLDMDDEALEEDCVRAMREEVEPILMAADQGETVDPARVIPALQALFSARSLIIERGRMSLLVETTLSIHQLQPLARFGQLPIDSIPRDPKNLAAFIEAEERARANALWIATDVASTAARLALPESLPAQAGKSQPWLDCAAPCPDHVFDSLPPKPVTESDWNSWYNLDAARGGILASVPLRTLRYLTSWPDLPRGSEERNAIVGFAVGRFLRNGLEAVLPVVMDLWGRVTHLRNLFRESGIEVYAEIDQEAVLGKVAAEALEKRKEVADALEDFYAGLPEDVQRAKDAIHGTTSNVDASSSARESRTADELMGLAVRWYGKSRRFRLASMLFFVHSLEMLMNSPHDPRLEIEKRQPSWSQAGGFRHALHNAESICRLIIGMLKPPLPQPKGTPVDPLALTAEEHLIERRKLIIPIWSFAMSRAAWVQVMQARVLGDGLRKAVDENERKELEKEKKALMDVVEATVEVLNGMNSEGQGWRNVNLAYSAVHASILRLLAFGRPDVEDGQGWLFTEEEVGKLGWWANNMYTLGDGVMERAQFDKPGEGGKPWEKMDTQ